MKKGVKYIYHWKLVLDIEIYDKLDQSGYSIFSSHIINPSIE